MKLSELICRSGQITFSTATILLQPVYLYAHNWNKTDKVAEVVRKNEDYIRNKILIKGIDIGEIEGKYEYKNVLDADGMPVTDPETDDDIFSLDLFVSWVNITTLMNYVYKDIGDINCIPIELQHLIYEELLECASELIDTKYDPKIDKLVCQGIAKTLWDIDPELTIKAISNHRAIQVYGNGKQYKDPKTVSGWISEVDPRSSAKKRGRKKVDDPKAISE